MKKFALVSIALPPSQSGQSIVLFNILKNLDPRIYCLITQKNINQYSFTPQCSETLPAGYYFLQPDYQFVRMFIKAASMVQSTSMLNFALNLRTYQIKKIMRKEQCRAVIACTGDLFDPPAAYSASRELGVPFIFYAFDYYSGQATDPLLRSFAAKYESEFIRAAAKVIVPNECMYKEYFKRYGIHATILHNPVDIEDYEIQAQRGDNSNTFGGAETKIVYTGAIYDMHYDAFRNLIAAFHFLDGSPIKIHLYTPQYQHNLDKNNITGPMIAVHKAEPVTSMATVQQQADILFLPLSFNPQFREIIKTSAPGKIGEYLASGRPVLVHAPKDSFVSWYFKKHRCGLVVDEEDPRVLAQAIDRLITDKKFCQEITQNAYERAKTDFDIRDVQTKFHDLINLAYHP